LTALAEFQFNSRRRADIETCSFGIGIFSGHLMATVRAYNLEVDNQHWGKGAAERGSEERNVMGFCLGLSAWWILRGIFMVWLQRFPYSKEFSGFIFTG
jgi:hypothetical protein